jgi:RHS repeat-associated protein
MTAPPATSGGSSRVTSDTYNAAGQLATETTGYGTSAASTVSYCYDPNGNKTSVVYADGNISGTAQCLTSSPWAVAASPQVNYQTTYSYDSAGELVSTTTPATTFAVGGATTTSTYDTAGNKLTSTDPDGVTTTWTYTPLNEAATESYSGSSTHTVTYSHDASGNITGMTDATGTSSNIYDPFGELASTTNGAGQVTSYGYDADGAVTGITYPLPGNHSWAATTTVVYGYDHADLRTSVSDFNNNQISITPNADGLTATVGLGTSGDTINATYDDADAPSMITLKNASSTLQSFTDSYGPSGDITNETATPSSSQTPAVYTYDAQARVTSMTPGAGSTLNYAFDPSSNLTTLPTAASATYDNAGELTSSTLAGTTTSYAYNKDGERLSAMQGTTSVGTASWNGAGELTGYTDAAATMTTATYDGNGLRTSASMTPSGGSTVTQQYVWNVVSGIPEMIIDGSNAYIYTDSQAPVEQVNLTSGAITYLVADLLGSVRGAVSSAGALTGTASYDAWGNPESGAGLTGTTLFGFAGGYTDPDGFLYLLNRYYDPSAGQFVSVDPKLSETGQPYSYANGNPVNETDPNGTLPFHWTPHCGVRVFGICVLINGVTIYFTRKTTETFAAIGIPVMAALEGSLRYVLSKFLIDEAVDAIVSYILDHVGDGVLEAIDIVENHPKRCLAMTAAAIPWPAIYWGSYKFPKRWCNAMYAIK